MGYVAAEESRAVLENRTVRNVYRDVPVTGCNNSLLPLYRQPIAAFQELPLLNGYGCHDKPSAGTAEIESPTCSLPWECGGGGETLHPITEQGDALDALAYQKDTRNLIMGN
jgi:hypothetical protein